MPSCDMHWRQGEHNELLAQELSDNVPIRYKDWAVTIAFYAAVHYVEAYLATRLIHSEQHRPQSPHVFRLHYVKKNLGSQAADAYGVLFANSVQLRYLAHNGQTVSDIAGRWLTDEDVIIHVRDELQTVKSEVQSRMSSSNTVTP